MKPLIVGNLKSSCRQMSGRYRLLNVVTERIVNALPDPLANSERDDKETTMSSAISDFAHAGAEIDEISVSISYDIIRLFSEGLYKSRIRR